MKVRVFVDFWNFDLCIKAVESAFKIDWQRLGEVVALDAAQTIDPGMSSRTVGYRGLNFYGSYDPATQAGRKLENWATNTVGGFQGVSVYMYERQRKKEPPKCPICQRMVSRCPDANCDADMRGKEEKGVDVQMAVDMISLALEDDYAAAVILSSDRDFIPVANFLDQRDVKVVHGHFPDQGDALSDSCWDSIEIPEIMEAFRR